MTDQNNPPQESHPNPSYRSAVNWLRLLAGNLATTGEVMTLVAQRDRAEGTSLRLEAELIKTRRTVAGLRQELDALKTEIQQLASSTAWISVENKLPPVQADGVSDPVLCKGYRMISGRVELEVGVYNANLGVWFTSKIIPSHWRFLPDSEINNDH